MQFQRDRAINLVVQMSWLEGEIACLIHDEAWDPRKDSAHSVRRVFINLAAVFIHDQQIACAIKGQT